MFSFPNYEYATNAAYDILQQYDGYFPQIDIYKIFDNMKNVKIYKYSEFSKRFNIKAYDFEHLIAPSEYGYTIFDKKKNKWLLHYNEIKSEETIRFTLAHELGHIVLNHTNDNEYNDREANCFARNILCPLPIRDMYNLKTPLDYCECFFISQPMAVATIANYKSDSYYISKYNYMVTQNKLSFKTHIIGKLSR